MLSSSEESQLRELMTEALVLICRNAVVFEKHLGLKASIDLTIDQECLSTINVYTVMYKPQQHERSNRKVPITEKQKQQSRQKRQEPLQNSNLKGNLAGKTSKDAKVDIEQQTDLTDLYAEVEQLAGKVKHGITRTQKNNSDSGKRDENVEHFKSTAAQLEMSKDCDSSEDDADNKTVEACDETDTALAPPHRHSDSSEGFSLAPPSVTDNIMQSTLPVTESSHLEEWPYQVNDSFPNYMQPKVKDEITVEQNGTIQTVIVGDGYAAIIENVHVIVPDSGQIQVPGKFEEDDESTMQTIIVGCDEVNSCDDEHGIVPEMDHMEICINNEEENSTIQTVIVGEDTAGDMMVVPEADHEADHEADDVADDSDEQLLMVTGMAADEESALHLMQPGETFEYNGMTYQIACDDAIGDHLPSSPKKLADKGDELRMKKGNHTKSEKPKKFMCSMCSQRFTTHWGLKLHERLHNGDFRYHCKICNKGFTSSVNVRGHMVKHSQQKEFSCEFCGKAFAYRQSLERHQVRKGDTLCKGDILCSGLKKGKPKPLQPKRQKRSGRKSIFRTALKIVEVEPAEVIA